MYLLCRCLISRIMYLHLDLFWDVVQLTVYYLLHKIWFANLMYRLSRCAVPTWPEYEFISFFVQLALFAPSDQFELYQRLRFERGTCLSCFMYVCMYLYAASQNNSWKTVLLEPSLKITECERQEQTVLVKRLSYKEAYF